MKPPPVITCHEPLRVVRYKPYSQPRHRLFCFPYAGGGLSAFQKWPQFLPDDLEVCSVELPGRDTMLCVPPLTDMSELVDAIVASLELALNLPFALFGHSMGSLIGFEIARALRARQLPQPSVLIVSGHRAAHLPDTRPPLHLLPDVRFLLEMQKLCGTPEEFLANRELVDLFTPLLRADFQLCETYKHQRDEPLGCPIVAIGGASDNAVSSKDLEAWAELTSRLFRLRLVPGGHLFIQTSAHDVLDVIREQLREFLITA